MPYVASDEAQNATVIDTVGVERKLRPGGRRAPLVASDLLRVVLLRMERDEEPHRPHRHPQADEVMIVTAGRGTFTVGGEPGRVVGRGGMVYVPRGVIHRIQVTGPEPLAWLSIVAPNQDAPDEAVEEEG